MSTKITVPEAIDLFRQIQKRDKFFEMIRFNVQEEVGKYFTMKKGSNLLLTLLTQKSNFSALLPPFFQLSNVRTSCQYPQFGKISETRSISELLMITDGSLRLLTDYVNHRVQEETLVLSKIPR